MVLCKFYLSGHCRFGESCHFEHGSGRNYEEQSRHGGRHHQEPVVQANKFSFNRVLEQTTQRGTGQTGSAGGQFSFNKALQATRQVNYQEEDLRANLNRRHVTFESQPQYQQPQYVQQRTQYETPKSTNQFSRNYANAAPKPATGFSFNKLLSDAKGQAATPAYGHQQVVRQSSFGRPLTSYGDLDQEMNFSTPASTFPGTAPSRHEFVSHQSNQPSVPKNDQQISPDYSSPSSLTAEEIEQFNAPNFVFGKIPEHPPMMEAC